MENGFYTMTYTGVEGMGLGALLLEDGKIRGFDVGRCSYDGNYSKNQTGGLAAQITMTVPPNTPLVFGMPPQAKEYQLPISAMLPANFGSGVPVPVKVGPGSVQVSFTKMRNA